MPSLVGFTSLAGVRVHYDRHGRGAYAYGTQGTPCVLVASAPFRDRLAACFGELWRVCPYGRAATIVSAGAHVEKPGFHGQGRAFDLDAIFWPGRRVFRAIDFPAHPFLSLAIEAVLRRHFGTVLGFAYDGAHRDHFHVDDGTEPRFRPDVRSCVQFLQAAARHLAGRDLESDGRWSAGTEEAVSAVLETLHLQGDLRESAFWLELLARTARAAFDVEVARAGHSRPGLRPPRWTMLPLLARHDPETTAFIERFREGQRAAGGPAALHLTWARRPTIAPSVKLAVLYAEDSRFLSHRGLDWAEIGRAVKDAVVGRQRLRGASTLTQQLAKNIWLTPERRVARKVKEAALALGLELALSKARILELYLNVVELGPGVFGVEAAAARFFQKTAAQPSLREAAELAAMLPRPSSWYPGCGDPAYERRVAEIERMVRDGGPEGLVRDGILRRAVRFLLRQLRR